MVYNHENINQNKDIIENMINKRNELIIQRNTLEKEIEYLNLLIGDDESG